MGNEDIESENSQSKDEKATITSIDIDYSSNEV